MSICFRNDTIVFPVIYGKEFRIQVQEGKKKPKEYKKLVTQGIETNEAMRKTYIYLAKKFLEKDKDNK